MDLKGGWNGWKQLILQEMNYQIPDTSNIPNYVPKPPKAKINSITVRGIVQIKFSKDMFEIPDLNNQTVKVPQRKLS